VIVFDVGVQISFCVKFLFKDEDWLELNAQVAIVEFVSTVVMFF
jgi:hypothetical protein